MSKHHKGSGGPGSPGSAYKGTGTQIKFSIEDMLEVVISTALRITDAERARARLNDLVTSAFGAKYGAKMRQLETLLDHTRKEHAQTEAELGHLRKLQADTPEWVPASRENHARSADEHVETPVWRWQFRHQVSALTIFLLMIVALGASALTAHANLVGTGLPVFLENPLLPWSMAMLAPMSALAIKAMAAHIRREGAKSLFNLAVMIAAGLSIAAWGTLFAMNYHGLSASTALGGLFDEPSFWDEVRDTGFVAATLSTEILVGAVLALNLGKIAANYAPDYWFKNLQYEAREKQIARVAAKLIELGEHLARLEGESFEYAESLRLQIELAIFAHDGRRGASDQSIL
ncbi:MAG: hypothetical protein KDA50_06480 [Rhodobacteraceae bacterium]|nr:hypothetical protein [Paracoccaceae bacterium]